MNILIPGISGIIGTIVARHWLAQRHNIIGISRSPNQARKYLPEPITLIDWNALTPELFSVRQIDAIVNFSGAPMIQRWDRQTKPEILNSRQNSLDSIYGVVRKLSPSRRPKSIVSASSVAIYSTQSQSVDESIHPDLDINFFQSLVWRKLEKRVRELSIPDVRTVIARIGLVVGPYSMMQSLFRCSRYFAGAVIGNGTQKISWISHHDLARAFDRFISDQSLSGTYNVVSPEIVTSAQMSCHIAEVVHRPVWIQIPERLLRAVLGELAENFLISAAVEPARLKGANFNWNLPDFRTAVAQAHWELQAASRSNIAYHLSN